MRTKILLLGIICFLLIFLPCCKKSAPTLPDTSNIDNNPPVIVKNPPVINSFTVSPSSIKLGESSTLSWSISLATQITIDQGIGGVSASGTIEVSPTDSTVYTLTASNSDGQTTRAVTLEIKKWAILNISTIPLMPIFFWNYIYFNYYSSFTVVITESNGVGGSIDTIKVGTYLLGQLCWLNTYINIGGFNPSSTLQVYLAAVYSTAQHSEMWITIEGTDDNGYRFTEGAVYYFIWTGNRAQGVFLRKIEGEHIKIK